MTRLATAAFAITVLASMSPAFAGGPRSVVQDWAAAHEEGGAARAASLYTPAARVWSVAAPREWVGHAEIGHYLAVFPLGASRPEFRIDEVVLSPVRDGVAMATGHCTVVREQWDGSIAHEGCRFSLTLVQDEAGMWRIAEQHSSAVPR